MPPTVTMRMAAFAELDATTLYALLRLRVDVFVVEQRCPYPELDGRDTEPATRHLWLERGPGPPPAPAAVPVPRTAPVPVPRTAAVPVPRTAPVPVPRTAPVPVPRTAAEPVAYLRMVAEPGGAVRIGRVVVTRDARRAGLASRLIAAALAEVGDRQCVLDAQSHLAGFYTRLGFTRTGPEFIDDGIPHLPMRRTGPAGSRRHRR